MIINRIYTTANKIASEKLEYQEEQIRELEYRQNNDRYSKKRQQLINSIARSNPLRRIGDEEHAQAILAASHRHNNTNYESMLDTARAMAELGEIEREDVKSFARTHMHHYAV